MWRNACQFPESILDDSTCLLAPFPLLLKVWCDVCQENINGIIMKCLGSTRLQHLDDRQCLSGYMLKVWCDVWQENISGIIMKCLGSILMIAAPSKIAHVNCTATLSLTGISSCKQLNKSDICPSSQDTHVWYCWWTSLVFMLEKLVKVTTEYLWDNAQSREKWAVILQCWNLQLFAWLLSDWRLAEEWEVGSVMDLVWWTSLTSMYVWY